MSSHRNTHHDQRRDGHQSNVATGRVRLMAGTVAIVALAITACGPPLESGRASTVEPLGAVTPAFDNGPTWQPNREALDLRLGRRGPSPAAATVEFGGMPAPWGGPDLSGLEEPAAVNHSAPTWQPNHGRLESYVGSTDQAGPR